jgi:hypothetical protein
MMQTINNIIKEIRNIPLDRLPELYSVVVSLKGKSNFTEDSKTKILSFAGLFKEMDEGDYQTFKLNLNNSRKNLFDRKVIL